MQDRKNGSLWHGLKDVIHELGALAIGLVLAGAMVHCVVAGRPIPAELTTLVLTVVAYFLGVGAGRASSQNGH